MSSVGRFNQELDSDQYQQLMETKISKKATFRDLAIVMSKGKGFGRFFTQLGLVFRGKGWVSADLLKGLNIRDLIEIKNQCDGVILTESSDDESDVQILRNKKTAKRIHRIHKLGEAVLVEVEKRDQESIEELSFLRSKKLVDLLENPKLAPFFLSFVKEEKKGEACVHSNCPKIKEGIQVLALDLPGNVSVEKVNSLIEKAEVDEDVVLEGFLEYLAERKTERKFSLIEQVNFEIGLHLVREDMDQVKQWQDKLESIITRMSEFYEEEGNAKVLYDKYPAIHDEYQTFAGRESGSEYKSFFNWLSEQYVKGEIDSASAAGHWFAKRVDQNRLPKEFIIEEHWQAYLRICHILDTEEKTGQYQYIAALVEDLEFAESAAAFVENMINDKSLTAIAFYEKFSEGLEELKKRFDSKILEERGVKPADPYLKDFSSALYLAAGLFLETNQIKKLESKLEVIDETVTGRDAASSFFTAIETGKNWVKKVASSL